MKRFVALFLTFLLCLGTFAVPALAEEEPVELDVVLILQAVSTAPEDKAFSKNQSAVSDHGPEGPVKDLPGLHRPDHPA